MFANLKNKLIEEVKASPSKFQQFANAAQAAVSSSSTTTTPNSSENTDTGTPENFFSITEEDTPQNSPYHIQKLPRGGRTSTQSLNGMGGSGAIPRTRKLSNSSMASDVSFRLPTYDAPAMYHLQSDLDETSSEFDDSASTARLDVISKDQLYDAYKKSLDRYHKYRCRYTDLAKKYKELERDSSKARSVLVETQDKALRRISELREQCTLEQQAKAHLEEALRIEMDDMSCKMQAYQTKLKLLGENPDNVSAALERGQSNSADKLIDLEEPIIKTTTEAAPTVNGSQPTRETDNELAQLRQLLTEQESQLMEIKKHNEEANTTIAALRKQEEENVLLLAQTKQAIHTELEHKEAEVRQLQENVKQLEIELDIANAKEAQTVDIKEQLKKLQSDKQEVDAKLIATEHILSTLRGDMVAQQKKFDSELASREKEVKQLQEQLKQLEDDLEQANTRETQSEDVKEQLKQLLNAKQEAEAKLASMEQQLNEQTKKEHELTSELTKTLSKLKQNEDKHQQLVEKLKQLEADLELANSRETQDGDFREQLQNAKQEAEAKLHAMERQLNTLKLEQTEKEAQQKQNQFTLEQQKENEVRQLQKTLKQLQAELETSNSSKTQADEVKEQLRQLQDAKQEANNKLLETEQQLNSLKLEHTEKEQQVDALTKQLQTLKTDSEQSLQDLHLQNNQLNEIVQRYQLNESSLEELQSQLEDARTSLREQEQRVLETEKTLEQEHEIVSVLTVEKTAAEEQTLKLQRELQSLSDQIASSTNNESETIANLRQQIETLNEKLAAAQAKEKELKTGAGKLNKLKKQHEQLQAKHSEQAVSLEKLKLEAAKVEELRNEKQELQERVTVILDEIRTMQTHLQDVQAAQTQLESEKRQLETHIGALQEQQQQNDAQGELSTARIVEIESENSKLAEHNCLLQEQNNHLEKQQAELIKLQGKMQQVLDEHSKLQNAQEIMEHDHRTLQDKCDAYEKENLVAKNELKCIQEAKAALEQQANTLQLDLDQAQQQLEEVRERGHELQQQLQDQTERSVELEAKTEQLATLQSTVHNLRQQLESLKEIEQANLDKAQTVNAAHATQLTTLQARCTAANGDVERLQEANDALQREIETLKTSNGLERTKTDYEQLQLENEYLNKHTKQLEAELSLALANHGDSGEKLKSLQCELYVLQDQVLQHDSQLAEKDAISNALKTETAQLKSMLEEQTLELTRQSEHARFVSEQNDAVQKELMQMQQQLQERQAELTKTEERCLSLEEQLNNKRNEQELKLEQKQLQTSATATLPNDSEHLRSLNEQLQRELEDLKHKSNGEQSNLQQEIDELQSNNKEMMERITELETLRAGIQAQQLLASLAPKSVQQAVASDEKALLEAKLKDIMSEVQDVTNRNLFLEQKCENFLILEQSNERLKLQNAKLSRQLDETLVSMQHSDSVPANTEFEYLRNIMFQYLTGNTNNETLVKVISAVLKFSPQQAQVALEKEHQRRSILNKLI